MTDRRTSFQFKASFSPCTIMQITRYDLDALEKELAATISRTPQFFTGSPIVIDLDIVKTFGTLDFTRIKKIILANGMAPIGVRGGSQEQQREAANAGLQLLMIGKSAMVEDNKNKTNERANTTKFLTNPIRSGMQVYAKDGDLIITAPVSPGAELLADGYIHVYGPLRGRALAGVQGNTEARIFCRTLEAELVSIAGYYLTQEDMQSLPKHEGTIQIYLENEQIRIEAI